jgi:glutamate--cysteine ligase
MLSLKTAYQEELSFLETQILKKIQDIEVWFRQAWQETPPPLMSSVDLRHAGFKIAPVDTNLFPAGFSNLNADFLPLCVQALQSIIFQLHPTCRSVLIIPEAHTRNEYYFNSLKVLCSIFTTAGFKVRVGHWAISGEINGVHVELIERVQDTLQVGGEEPCLVVLNNDLSEGTPAILKGLSQKMFPDPLMGWEYRRKSGHFRLYKKVVEEFSSLIDCDPWLMFPEMAVVKHVDFMAKVGVEDVAKAVDHVLEKTVAHYKKYNITEPPFVVVKPDNGTYGMGVMSVHDGKSLLALNRKQRTSMAAIKGGEAVRRVLVQEGIYTLETMPDGSVAEPVIYMIGQHVVGGFYRVHQNKSNDENLNAPGMLFEPLAFDAACNMPSCGKLEANKANRFYVYGVIARLAALAAGREEQEE